MYVYIHIHTLDLLIVQILLQCQMTEA